MKKIKTVEKKNVTKLLKGLVTMTTALAISTSGYAANVIPPPQGQPHVELPNHSVDLNNRND